MNPSTKPQKTAKVEPAEEEPKEDEEGEEKPKEVESEVDEESEDFDIDDEIAARVEFDTSVYKEVTPHVAKMTSTSDATGGF